MGFSLARPGLLAGLNALTGSITRARKEKKTAKKRFEEACRTKNNEEKIIEKEKYQQAQRTLRNEIEKHEREIIE